MTDRKWFIEWHEHWSQFFQSCNWYTFQFCHIEFEYDPLMGGVEFTFIILGLGFRWRWNYTVTERAQELQDRVSKVTERLDAGENFSDILNSKKENKK